jgi:4-hydroxythreonine-4-phosphate dehydrogenase
MKNIPKIIITPGEPSGIGYDIVLDIPKENFQANIIVAANIDFLKDRARLLNKKINIVEVSIYDKNLTKELNNTICVHNIIENNKVVIGKPDIKHAPLVLKSLDTAIDACLDNFADAMVTGPVQKSTIMEYGEKFSGHTEYIASKTGGQPIMMLHTVDTRIALLTTHVSLSKVPSLVTKERIETNVEIITNDLIEKFGINNPKISVCGLNPHAGENGYIGTEEKNIIIPAIKYLKNKGFNVEGPFSADTIFTRSEKTDLILAMFHDQALPVIKTIGFGDIVNTTLGLPIIRTSVDHGTALDIAGTNRANPKSLVTAVRTSIDIVNQKNAR